MTEASNDSQDSVKPKEPPFQEEKFKALLGLDSNDAGEMRMRIALGERGAIEGEPGKPNMADPAVFTAHWLNKNLEAILSIISHEYATAMALQTTKQNLAIVRDGMAEAPRIVLPGEGG